MSDQTITLKTVNDLRLDASGAAQHYFIASYQRGYRWSPNQVTQLLEDIREFTHRRDPQPEEFYCLQPLVLKVSASGGYEVVDGQQRLTTLLLILRHFNERLAEKYRQPLFTLDYETRPNLLEFLNQPTEAIAKINVDFFHLFGAVTTIEKWFSDKENMVEEIKSALLNKTKVIWFQLSERDNAVEAFTRLNVGKIPLTNDELIRALFLKRTNAEESEADALQHKIAHEWDQLEKTLQSDAFWYFLSNQGGKAQNRIGFLFDLVARAEGLPPGAEHDTYGIFYAFSQKLKVAGASPEQEWRKIKQTGEVTELSRLLTNQPWYFRNWRLDPTVQSTLVMLDAIHRRFASAKGLFERLTSESQPAITFQLLDLKNFGLSDDLYIKMNARGKPLTSFETFKARYEQELGKQFVGETRRIDDQQFSIADFVARRMDTAWSDLFWAHRDKETNLYDSAVMNVFRAVALVTRDPESKSFSEDVSSLRNVWRAPSYADFHFKGWLDRNFTTTLICLLEAWSKGGGTLAVQLPNNRFFDEKAILTKLVASPADLSYTEVVQFAAYVSFIREHEGTLEPQTFQEWMRVIFNLSENTSYDRTDDLQRSMVGIKTLLPGSGKVLKYFVASEKPTAGFSQQQIGEEKLKAELILGHSGWWSLIDRAENHGYFRGQIEFLLEFCGAVAPGTEKGNANRDDGLHLSLQGRFEEYLKKAEAMFGPQGLNDLGKYRWQRALLSIGDYLLPSRRQNISFLVNSSKEQASWKRLLRGTGPKVPEAQKLLHQLLDRLTEGTPVTEQLDKIIADSTSLEPWREAFVRTPEAINYCGYQAIRMNSPDDVYLLKKSQLNGTHAELFGYCFYQNVLLPLSNRGGLAPLILCGYYSANNLNFEPQILITFAHERYNISIKIEFKKGSFVIGVEGTSLENQPDIVAIFTDSLGFVQNEGRLSKAISTTAIESTLLGLTQALQKHPIPIRAIPDQSA